MQIEYEFFINPQQLSEADLQAINELLTQLHGRPCQTERSHLEAVIQSSSFLVARDLDQSGWIVGMSCLAVFLTPTGRQGWIEDVVVEKAYRGHGLGIELTNRLVLTARQLGLPGVSLTSNPKRVEANRLYQKLGFKQKETNFYRLSFD